MTDTDLNANYQQWPRQSEQINDLAAALAKAQGKIGPAAKGSVNPFFKSSYADLASIWAVCQPALSEQGLCVVQPTELDASGGLVLRTILIHSSGQWIEGRYAIRTQKQDPQALGSAVKYARRYALSAMVGVVDGDDDGEGSMSRETDNGKKKPPLKPPEKKQTPKRDFAGDPSAIPDDEKHKELSQAQLKRLYAIADAKGWNGEATKKYIQEHFGASSSKELTWVQYDQLIKTIESGEPPF